MEAYFEVTNLKCSVKVPAKNQALIPTLSKERCALFGLNCVEYGSFKVIKPPHGSVRYIVFNLKQNSPYKHINISGVRDTIQLEECTQQVTKLLNLEGYQTQFEITIDNITGRSNCLEKSENLNLCKLSSSLREKGLECRYNPEVFSAVVVKQGKCTVLVFSTTKIIVISAKSLREVYSLLTLIYNVVHP